MFKTYNLREFMAGVPGAEEAIIRQVEAVRGFALQKIDREIISEFMVPEYMVLNTKSYEDNSFYDARKQITVGAKQYVIHDKEGAIWAAISLAKHRFSTGDVLQSFKEYCDTNDMEMMIDSQDWELREWCNGTAAGYDLTVTSVSDKPCITPVHNYPELIKGELVLYPGGRTKTLLSVLKDIAKFKLYRVGEKHRKVLDEYDSSYAMGRFTHDGQKCVVKDHTISVRRDDGLIEEITISSLGQDLLKEIV